MEAQRPPPLESGGRLSASPYFLCFEIPIGSPHRKPNIYEVYIGGRSSICVWNHTLILCSNPVPLFSSEEDLEQLDTIIPCDLVSEKDRIHQVS